MEVRLLGPLEVVGDDGTPVSVGGPRPRALLALLALRPGEVVSTDRLIDGIWGETPPASATGALQVHVHALRKALGHDRVVTREPGYALRLEPGELDRERFESLVREADTELAGGRAARAAALLRQALGLWRGEALADLAFVSFASVEAERLEETRLAAVERRIDADLALGRHGELVGELETLVARHPLRERFRAQLMLALYRSGRQAEALGAYQDARRTLVEELGIDPTAELRELEQAILRQDPALAAPAAPAAESPAAAAEPSEPLIGRELELAAVGALLRQPGVRLLTLTGTGGTGKTRLARALAESEGASVFVDLAPVSDAALVLPTIAHALGLEELDARPLLDDVAAALDGSRLLVLDNLEHLPGCFPDVASLLAAAPEAQRILATSRAPLRIAAEREYRVPPLATPDL